MGAIDDDILQWLRHDLRDYLDLPVKTMGSLAIPEESFLRNRNQHHSTVILKEILAEVPPDALKILGLIDRDLCIPILTFVFGEAQLGGTASLVSLARLRQEFYGLPPEPSLFRERLYKECLHELGHNFGRTHAPCGNPAGADPFYPVADGALDAYGYDAAAGAVQSPATTYDLMSYCSPRWISAYNYKGVFNYLGGRAGPTVASTGTAERVPTLVVWGRIPARGRPILEPAFEVTTLPRLPEGSGPFRIEALSADGSLLFSRAFPGEQVADDAGGERQFAFAIPLALIGDTPVARLRLVAPGGTVTRESAPRPGQGVRAQAQRGPAAVSSTRTPTGVLLSWDARRYPMLMTRNAATGQVLSLTRAGQATLPAGRLPMEVLLSDGVTSESLVVVP